MAERDRERADCVGVVHKAVKLCALLARLGNRVADNDEAAGKNFQMVARASNLLRARFHVGIELSSGGEARLSREYGFRCFRRKLPAGIGRTGLNDDGPALDRPRDVERAAYRKVFTFVREHMQLVGIE